MSPSAGSEPVVPDYGGRCIAGIVPALLRRRTGLPDWLPQQLAEVDRVVLLVLDGLGWRQLQERRSLAPTLAAAEGGPIHSVAPTTTSVALTSISTGSPPATHGVLGYRVMTPAGVLNVLRWTVDGHDVRDHLIPEQEVRAQPFGGHAVPVVTHASFGHSGFTRVAFSTGVFRGWRASSSIAVEVAGALADGAELVYAYYDGVDKIAHAHGLGEHYDAELVAADVLVASILDRLPAKSALVITSDHGQVDVGENLVMLGPEVVQRTEATSGEGRFLWLHGAEPDLLDAARAAHGGDAWVHSRAELIDAGWFGGPIGDDRLDRLGDVALIAREPVAFVEPNEPPAPLVARHGSLTAAEVEVPALATWS